MKIIGHRGARGLAAENTLDSIQASLDAGADGVEFDVRVSRDGVPVLCHDRIIKNGTTIKFIAQTDYAELLTTQPALTTLAQALQLIDNRATPYIEVKGGEPTAPIVAVLQEVIDVVYSAGDLRLGSKSQRTLRALHATLPDVPTVVIEPWSGLRASWRARQLDTKHICMRSWWLWSGFIRAMNHRGYILSAYTVNNPAKARRWARHGLAAVVTDFPDRYR